ncbi:hypothetical protein [Pseudomonas aeruginosa]|uniref:hypothetical protein n=1 Tax=Pseudomonas aeruginosa TaxID=287 RepID=UPI0032B5B0DE
MTKNETVANETSENKSIAALHWLLCIAAGIPTTIAAFFVSFPVSQGLTSVALTLTATYLLCQLGQKGLRYLGYLHEVLYMAEVMGTYHRGTRLNAQQIMAIGPVLDRHSYGEFASEAEFESAVDQALAQLQSEGANNRRAGCA